MRQLALIPYAFENPRAVPLHSDVCSVSQDHNFRDFSVSLRADRRASCGHKKKQMDQVEKRLKAEDQRHPSQVTAGGKTHNTLVNS